MSANPKFDKALEKMREVHDKKNADYATSEDPYQNFRFAAQCAGTTIDRVLMTLIGVKVARLAELTSKNKTPNFESIKDTKLDLAVYSALLLSLEE